MCERVADNLNLFGCRVLAVTLRECDSFFEVRFVFVLVIAAGATILDPVSLCCDV